METAETKSPAQIAYEEDCKRKPYYHNGAPRKPWHALDEVSRWSWRKNPTPREYTNA